MSRSSVTLGPRSSPTSYRGRVRQLEGNRIIATLSGPANRTLRVAMTVTIDGEQHVSGTIAAGAEGVGGR